MRILLLFLLIALDPTFAQNASTRAAANENLVLIWNLAGLNLADKNELERKVCLSFGDPKITAVRKSKKIEPGTSNFYLLKTLSKEKCPFGSGAYNRYVSEAGLIRITLSLTLDRNVVCITAHDVRLLADDTKKVNSSHPGSYSLDVRDVNLENLLSFAFKEPRESCAESIFIGTNN